MTGMEEKQVISNAEIFKLLQSVSIEIKGELSAIKVQLGLQDKLLEDIQTENVTLKQEIKGLEKRVSFLERDRREKNLIFYNIEELEGAPLQNSLIDFLEKQMRIRLQPHEIDDVFRIGRRDTNTDNKRPVILKLTSHLKRREILSNLKFLKGTKISVSEDLCREDREKKKILYSHFKAAKARGYPAKLFSYKVVINGISYTSDQLEDCNIGSSGEESKIRIPSEQRRSVSTPTSPVYYTQRVDTTEAIEESGARSELVSGHSTDIYSDTIVEQKSGNSKLVGKVIETRSRTVSASSNSSVGSRGKKK